MTTILEAVEHPTWSIKGWKIKFLLSERMLHQVKKLSRVNNWYEDPDVVAIWRDRLSVCYNSIYNFYDDFGIPPQIGDRLFDEDSGVIIQDRSIDGRLKTITFTLNY